MQRSVLTAPRLRLRYLCLALLILFGFTGELTLQSLATPDEVLRAEIVRLLGIDIAPGAPSAASAGMHHHHHKHKPGHMHQRCVLCLLLTLAAMMVAQAVIFPLSSQPVLRFYRVLFTARAPPPIFFPRPFGQAPPFYLETSCVARPPRAVRFHFYFRMNQCLPHMIGCAN